MPSCPCILNSVLGASRKHSRVNLGITSFWKLFSFQMWRAPLSTFVHLWTFVVLSNSHFVLPIRPLTAFISSPRAVLQSAAKFKSDGRQQATAHYVFVFVFVNVSYFVFVFSKFTDDGKQLQSQFILYRGLKVRKDIFLFSSDMSNFKSYATGIHLDWKLIFGTSIGCWFSLLWLACVREAPGPFGQSSTSVDCALIGCPLSGRCSCRSHCAPYCAVLCSPGALHHPLSNHIKSASNWVRTLLSSSLDISIVYLYLYEIPHGYIDIAHIWKRSDVFALEVDLLPADRRDSFGKFLISQVDRGNLKCLVGTKFERGSYRGSDLRREQGPEITCHLYTRGTPATHRYFCRNWISLRLPTIFVLSFLGDLSVFNLYSLPAPVFWFAWRGRRR